MIKTEKTKGIILLGLRLVIVFVFLWHGIPKVLGVEMAMLKFEGMGFPGFLGPIIGWLEVLGAFFILVGFQNKWANLLMAAIIVVALIGVQIPNGVTAGLERDLLLLFASLISAFFGPGILALKKSLIINQ